METLWQIDAPHFCCGVVVKDGRISEAAPILQWAIGKDWQWFKKYCQSKGWHGKEVCFNGCENITANPEWMKVIIAGCRTFEDYDFLADKLNFIFSNHFPDIVVCGMAKGADSLGERWAKEMGVQVDYFPANWEKYGKSAGYRRNAEMADNATHLVAFWDGQSKGTKHMIDLAKKKGLAVRVIKIPASNQNFF
jgi:hypothetical protein